jgi:hypothetical protein
MKATIKSYVEIPDDRSGPQSVLHHSQRSLFANNGDSDDNGSIAVVAPCDMGEGYTFMVATNDGNGDEDIMPVTVPPGGIRQGQIFYAASRSFANNNNSRSQSFSSCSTTLKIGSISSNISEWTPLAHQNSPHDLSFGQWKDRWFDCCRLGFCHVTLWNACCCPQILAAQILSRLQLNWLGDPIQYDIATVALPRKRLGTTTVSTFRRIVFMVILYWSLSTLTDPNHLPGPTSLVLYEGLPFNGSNEAVQRGDAYTLYNVINVLFGMYTFILLSKLRHQTRRVHRIPPSNSCKILICHIISGKNPDVQNDNGSLPEEDLRVSVDDCCMAACCGCCSVAQMARQTASYHKCNCSDEFTSMDHQYEHAVCCSINGLPQQSA